MSTDAIWERAMDWHERARACPGNTRLDAEIAAWRAEDPAHERAWLRVNRVWALTGMPAPIDPTSEIGARGTKAKRRWPVVVTGIAASLLLVVSVPAMILTLRADHTTGTAAMQTVTLADGSQVVLAPESAFAVHYSDNAREIELLKGQAFFDVAHNPSRPFRVRSGNDSVTVLGTAFDVSRGGDALTVSVARGVVRVANDGAAIGYTLRAGERVRLAESAQGSRLSRIVPAQAGAWRDGKLVAENLRFSDLVDEVARYHSGTIMLDDPALASRRVTGIFDLSRPEAALASAAGAFGAKVRHVTPWIWIVG